jgi:hypothetical protein
MGDRLGTPCAVGESSGGLVDPTSLTELTLLDGRRPLPLWDVIGLNLTLTLTQCAEPLRSEEDRKRSYCIANGGYRKLIGNQTEVNVRMLRKSKHCNPNY